VPEYFAFNTPGNCLPSWTFPSVNRHDVIAPSTIGDISGLRSENNWYMKFLTHATLLEKAKGIASWSRYFASTAYFCDFHTPLKYVFVALQYA